MNYTIIVPKSVQKQLDALTDDILETAEKYGQQLPDVAGAIERMKALSI